MSQCYINASINNGVVAEHQMELLLDKNVIMNIVTWECRSVKVVRQICTDCKVAVACYQRED